MKTFVENHQPFYATASEAELARLPQSVFQADCEDAPQLSCRFDNRMLTDPDLGPYEREILIYTLRKPARYSFHHITVELAQWLECGEEKVRKHLNRLIDLGYARRYKGIGPKGAGVWNYFFRELPVRREPGEDPRQPLAVPPCGDTGRLWVKGGSALPPDADPAAPPVRLKSEIPAKEAAEIVRTQRIQATKAAVKARGLGIHKAKCREAGAAARAEKMEANNAAREVRKARREARLNKAKSAASSSFSGGLMKHVETADKGYDMGSDDSHLHNEEESLSRPGDGDSVSFLNFTEAAVSSDAGASLGCASVGAPERTGFASMIPRGFSKTLNPEVASPAEPAAPAPQQPAHGARKRQGKRQPRKGGSRSFDLLPRAGRKIDRTAGHAFVLAYAARADDAMRDLADRSGMGRIEWCHRMMANPYFAMVQDVFRVPAWTCKLLRKWHRRLTNGKLRPDELLLLWQARFSLRTEGPPRELNMDDLPVERAIREVHKRLGRDRGRLKQIDVPDCVGQIEGALGYISIARMDVPQLLQRISRWVTEGVVSYANSLSRRKANAAAVAALLVAPFPAIGRLQPDWFGHGRTIQGLGCGGTMETCLPSERLNPLPGLDDVTSNHPHNEMVLFGVRENVVLDEVARDDRQSFTKVVFGFHELFFSGKTQAETAAVFAAACPELHAARVDRFPDEPWLNPSLKDVIES